MNKKGVVNETNSRYILYVPLLFNFLLFDGLKLWRDRKKVN